MRMYESVTILNVGPVVPHLKNLMEIVPRAKISTKFLIGEAKDVFEGKVTPKKAAKIVARIAACFYGQLDTDMWLIPYPPPSPRPPIPTLVGDHRKPPFYLSL